MNDVYDTWSSAWAALQKTLAKAPAPPVSSAQSGVPGANTWLGRARRPTTWKPAHDPAAATAL
jgi:hypothetical protein